MAEYFVYGQQEMEHLSRRDPVLGCAIERIGPVRREVTPDLFQSLMRTVVGQQISSKAADTVWGRVQALPGGVTPDSISRFSPEEIQSCGMSMRKVGYMQGIARAITDGSLNLRALPEMEDEQIIRSLSALPGVGVWTAQMLMIFSMQRPDVISWLDLGIRGGMAKLYGLEALDKKAFEHYAQGYRPYASVASLYLWHIWGSAGDL